MQARNGSTSRSAPTVGERGQKLQRAAPARRAAATATASRTMPPGWRVAQHAGLARVEVRGHASGRSSGSRNSERDHLLEPQPEDRSTRERCACRAGRDRRRHRTSVSRCSPKTARSASRDLADRGPGQHGVDHRRHQVLVRPRACASSASSARRQRRGVAPRAQRPHALDLRPLERGIDAQDVGRAAPRRPPGSGSRRRSRARPPRPRAGTGRPTPGSRAGSSPRSIARSAPPLRLDALEERAAPRARPRRWPPRPRRSRPAGRRVSATPDS